MVVLTMGCLGFPQAIFSPAPFGSERFRWTIPLKVPHMWTGRACDGMCLWVAVELVMGGKVDRGTGGTQWVSENASGFRISDTLW